MSVIIRKQSEIQILGYSIKQLAHTFQKHVSWKTKAIGLSRLKETKGT